jgi:hypothetical protein
MLNIAILRMPWKRTTLTMLAGARKKLTKLAIDGKAMVRRMPPEAFQPGPRKKERKKDVKVSMSVEVEVQTEVKVMKEAAVQTIEMAKVRPLTRTERRWARRQKLAAHCSSGNF